MELYLDIFILENTLLNLFVISLTSLVSCLKSSFLRKMMGSLAGTLFAVVILIYAPTLIESYTIKLLISALLVLIVYSPISLPEFFKTFVILCFCAMLVAGTMFFLLASTGSHFIIQNGILMVNAGLTPSIFIVTALLSVLFVKVLFRLKKVHAIQERLFVPLSISIDNKHISLRALIDTGNLLCDPLTNLPVIVTEYGALKEILPTELSNFMDTTKKLDMDNLSKSLYQSGWFRRLRLIPFSSLGNENDLLLGFKPDLVEIGDDRRKASQCIVGIYTRCLSKNMEFQALLGPQLI